ncbi:hypothetical protein CCAX7_17600 [Capsulimonas corticalis]|uniref:Cadherin-like domain-containing protein n=1 Tax=Capsulimonas corticalis TaxID=2219043 RepID=A0A402D3Z2_9BACT|nr:Ig-like domain-containing protein [Capsulimonas corticalis]BDI29709.1 hypothetical protein CCAX7_17600 [Capsulimonas corticalis]
MKKRVIAYGIAALGMAASSIHPACAQEYIRNFVAAPGNAALTLTGFNNQGQVSGNYYYARIAGIDTYHGFVWDAQTGFHDVAPQGTANNNLLALNEQGQTLGTSSPLGDFFRDTLGGIQWLNLSGFAYSPGKILTTSSQIAGHITVAGHLRAARWDPAAGALDIGQQLTTSSDSDALRISNTGFVCGYWNTGATALVNGWNFPVSHAFLWNPNTGVATDLGGLGGYYARAASINNSGQVVGNAETTGNASSHAFLATVSGTIQDLNSTLGISSSSNSYAADINNQGEIIGSADTIGNFVLDGLPTKIQYTAVGHPMAYASTLYRINDSGVILGTGAEWDPVLYRNNNGFIVLTPHRVPRNGSHSYSTYEDTALSVPKGPLLSGGGDGNSDISNLTAVLYTPAQPSLAITPQSTVAHGSVVLNPNGSFIYTPAPNFNGTDKFDFQIFDGVSYSAPATVYITVIPVNDPPVAFDSQQTLNENTLAVITPNASDVDGNALSYTITKNPVHGQLLTLSGKLTYVPNPNYYGSDSFQYKAFDGNVYSNVATVSLTINFVNVPPTVAPCTLTAYQGRVLSQAAPGLLSLASDANGDPLTVSLSVPPSTGTLTLKSNGAFSYQPNASIPFPLQDSFTIVVSDGHGGATPGVIYINILPAAQDVTSKYTIIRGGYIRTPSSTTFTQQVRLINNGADAFRGPISLVLDKLHNATLSNDTGITEIITPAGSPYVDQDINLLYPRQEISITLQFNDPTLAAISYTPRVLAGPGAR